MILVSSFRVVPLLALVSFTSLLGSERGLRNVGPNLFEQQREIWVTPFRGDTWKNESTLIFLLVSGASFSLDGDFSRDLRQNRSLDRFNAAIENDAVDIALHSLPVLILAYGRVSKKPDVTEFGWKSSEAALNAILVSRILKLATQRSRPHREDRFGFYEGGNAFPSGHATLAWSLAAVSASHFGERKWVPWVVYPLAGTISFSRISAGHHRASDVVVGTALGFFIGKYLVRD